MPPITIIGPNPALDHIIAVPGFAVGHVWRSGTSVHLAGGKPMNVARTLSRLASSSRLLMPLGGDKDEPRIFARACEELGIDLDVVPIAGTTRTCVVIANPLDGTATVINEEGPLMTHGESEDFTERALAAVVPGGLVLCSGSLARGLPLDLYARIAAEARERGAHCIVDVAGEPLRFAIAAGAWAVKVNADELASVSSCDVEGDDDSSTTTDLVRRYLAAAGDVLAHGVEHVVVTMGAEGALYVGARALYRVTAAAVTPLNPIGSGDAFLAGLAARLTAGAAWPEALRVASAAAGLNASRLEPDVGPAPDLESVLAGIEVTPL